MAAAKPSGGGKQPDSLAEFMDCASAHRMPRLAGVDARVHTPDAPSRHPGVSWQRR